MPNWHYSANQIWHLTETTYDTLKVEICSLNQYGFLFAICYHVCQFKAAVCTKTVKTICIPVKPCPIFHHRGEGGPRPTYCQNLRKSFIEGFFPKQSIELAGRILVGTVPELRLETVLQIGWAGEFIHIFYFLLQLCCYFVSLFAWLETDL